MFDPGHVSIRRRAARHRGTALGLWLPLLVLGVLLARLASLRQKAPAHALLPPRRRRNWKSGMQQLAQLREAIIGNPRSAIEEVFGFAPTIAGSADAAVLYYPLDQLLGRVIVIEFDGAIARDAQIFDSPRMLRRR
jgi:hypothetical protein